MNCISIVATSVVEDALILRNVPCNDCEKKNKNKHSIIVLRLPQYVGISSNQKEFSTGINKHLFLHDCPNG